MGVLGNQRLFKVVTNVLAKCFSHPQGITTYWCEIPWTFLSASLSPCHMSKTSSSAHSQGCKPAHWKLCPLIRVELFLGGGGGVLRLAPQWWSPPIWWGVGAWACAMQQPTQPWCLPCMLSGASSALSQASWQFPWCRSCYSCNGSCTPHGTICPEVVCPSPARSGVCDHTEKPLWCWNHCIV